MIASSSGAPVLPVFISGTAEAPTAWASLWHVGRARVLFGPLMRWPEETEAASITADIERWFRKMAVRRAG
jgi:1-acyl-sn-glycerol-3-phosphate acyltransferase